MKFYNGLVLFLLFIVISGGLLYFFQDRLIFQRVKLKRDFKYSFNEPFEEFFIPTKNNTELNVLWFKPLKAPKGTILYFHGNADNLQRWGKYANDFTSLGYEVIMIDYSGYGKSSGSPSESILYNDANELWVWAKNKIETKELIIYGRSLGSSVATHLAAEVQADLLILETPFDEIRSATLGRFILPLTPLHYKFQTKEYLINVKCRKVIFHGTNDWVVPISAAVKLKPLLSDSDKFIVIPEGSHNNLRDFVVYHTELAKALQ